MDNYELNVNTNNCNHIFSFKIDDNKYIHMSKIS